MLTPRCFISKQENKRKKKILKEIKNCQNCFVTVRAQDKGSGFFVISYDEYCEKVNTQIDRSSFTQLSHEITKSFKNKVNDFINKWEDLEVLDKN